MMGAALSRLWRYGRVFTARDADGENERSFMGFIEPMPPEGETVTHSRAGDVSRERFRLIAEPAEGFSCGLSTRVFCGESEYRLLGIREIYAGGQLSHRECVLRRAVSNA